MKKFLVLSLTLFTAFVVAACGTSDRPDFQMMWFSDGTEGQVMRELLERYRDETGVYIELFEIGWDVYETRLGTMIDGGEAPALVRTTEGVMNNFKDLLIELDDVFDTTAYTNIFYSANNLPLGLPMDVTANGLFVNTDILDRCGVEYPVRGDEDIWTWDEFTTEMDKLRDCDDVSVPGVFDFQGHRFMAMIYQQGVKIWNEPFTDSNLTSPEAVQALTILHDFYQNGMISKEVFVSGGAAAEMFQTGTVGFHMSGNWRVSGYGDNDFEWAVIPMPTGPEGHRATLLGGKAMSAVQGSGNEQAAKDFIAWLAEPANHDEFNNFVPFLSARIGAEIDFGEFQEAYSMFQDEINATDPAFVSDWLTQTQIPGMYPMINLMTDRAAEGVMTPLEILEALEASLIAAME
ncbi:MAG: sugar ABC transporter substrate-binding protein [Acholeplasmatales bacterium]|nr:MAG: sugar ABC transporter substrate-binding protein [Acholeplasmatales bacterium]